VQHSWEVIDRYCQYHPRWYEAASRYSPDKVHLRLFEEIIPDSWNLHRSGIWYNAEPPNAPLRDQGWKLHVSAGSDDSVEILRRSLPVLRDHRVWFKFLVDPRVTASVNSKLWPRGSSGKFITIYPGSDEQFQRLGDDLAEVLQDSKGPYILSDRRWPGSNVLFYRYGGFQPRSVLRVDGRRTLVIRHPNGELLPDDRNPYWSPPGWVKDPFPPETTSDGTGPVALGDGRFVVASALSFTNRGGVYEATDRQTGRTVIIKEARPGVEIGRCRLDATAALEKEHRLLHKLASTGSFAQPITFFHQKKKKKKTNKKKK